MSHTVVVDGAYRQRELTNHTNEIKRHCRIGRVEMKLPVRGYGTGTYGPAAGDFERLAFPDGPPVIRSEWGGETGAGNGFWTQETVDFFRPVFMEEFMKRHGTKMEQSDWVK